MWCLKSQRVFINSRCFVLIILSFGLLACSKAPTESTSQLSAGQPFPAIELVGLDKHTRSITSYRGKLVVLNLWATWCGPCRRELPSLQRLSSILDPARFAVIGLSVDDDDHVAREYLKDKNITFATFIDKDMRIALDVLNIDAFPLTYLIDSKGIIIQIIAGERAWDTPLNVEALHELYQGRPTELS